MRRWPALARTLPLAAAVMALPACDGGNGFNPNRLTPDDVAAVYNVCELRFVPSQTVLPAADLRTAVMNPAPPAPRQAPSLAVGGFQYDLVYTRKSDNFLQQLRGAVAYGSNEIELRFFSGDTPTGAAAELLLPDELTLAFQAAPRRLTSSGAGNLNYSVRRADYARAAGISEQNLSERIEGQLSARFQEGACP